jgi:hypothetical protein
MGMHIGLIAAKTSAAQLREAFLRTCPQYEVTASADQLNGADAVEKWRDAHAQFVSAADWSRDDPGRSVFVFWQDGPWAIFMDESFVHAAAENTLAALSTHLGTVISFTVETAAGCAFFYCFENGRLRRSISNLDTEMATEGEPLPEEVGINVGGYYMQETEELWRAFGLTPFQNLPPPTECQAICVIDRTDYEQLHKDRAPKPPAQTATVPKVSASNKPWWRFW